MTGTVAEWRSAAGDDYTIRNSIDSTHLNARVRLWSEIVRNFETTVYSVMEVGANVGLNLRALRQVAKGSKAKYVRVSDIAGYYATEPNAMAREILIRDGVCRDSDVYAGTANDIGYPDKFFDLVFTSGVLIHIQPDDLLKACTEIHRVSSRYIVAIEYFAADPEEKPYRGPAGKLWKRDFGAFYLDNFPDLKPLACGFSWKRESGLDNLTHWVFEKR